MCMHCHYLMMVCKSVRNGNFEEQPLILTPSLPWCHLKMTNKRLNLKPFSLFVFLFALACERIFMRMHCTESRCVIGPDNILFAGASAHFFFQPGNFTSWGRGGVKLNFVVANESKQSYPRSPFYTMHDTREAHCAIRVSPPPPINYIILKQTCT